MCWQLPSFCRCLPAGSFTANDATGMWSIRATSLLSGMTAQAPLLVEP
jgi:hypothetical protein